MESTADGIWSLLPPLPGISTEVEKMKDKNSKEYEKIKNEAVEELKEKWDQYIEEVVFSNPQKYYFITSRSLQYNYMSAEYNALLKKKGLKGGWDKKYKEESSRFDMFGQYLEQYLQRKYSVEKTWLKIKEPIKDRRKRAHDYVRSYTPNQMSGIELAMNMIALVAVENESKASLSNFKNKINSIESKAEDTAKVCSPQNKNIVKALYAASKRDQMILEDPMMLSLRDKAVKSGGIKAGDGGAATDMSRIPCFGLRRVEYNKEGLPATKEDESAYKQNQKWMQCLVNDDKKARIGQLKEMVEEFVKEIDLPEVPQNADADWLMDWFVKKYDGNYEKFFAIQRRGLALANQTMELKDFKTYLEKEMPDINAKLDCLDALISAILEGISWKYGLDINNNRIYSEAERKKRESREKSSVEILIGEYASRLEARNELKNKA